jgi:hypothetical protein
MPAVIQHIEEEVLHHQPATPYAPHGTPLSDWPLPIASSTKNIGKPDASLKTQFFSPALQLKSLIFRLVTKRSIVPMQAFTYKMRHARPTHVPAGVKLS